MDIFTDHCNLKKLNSEFVKDFFLHYAVDLADLVFQGFFCIS